MSNPYSINLGTVSYHGCLETNGLADGGAYAEARYAAGPPRKVDWTERGLRVTRLRLLGDPGPSFPYLDVSYCHGMIGDEHVEVMLPFNQLPRRGHKRAIVGYAKADKVFAHGLGILQNISILI